MIQLGISAFYHDSSACVVKDGIVLAAVEEERFTGIKHDSSFPINSIEWLLDYLKLSAADIDQVCWYEKPDLKKNRVLSVFKKNPLKTFFLRLKFLKEHQSEDKIRSLLKMAFRYEGEIKFVKHHKSHAAFSYYTSPFSSAVIVSLDGVGESETVTIYRGLGDRLHKMQSIEFPHSPGLLYSTMTAFLGFQPNEGEYKVMGLSAYGEDYLDFYQKLSDLINFLPGGAFTIDTTHFSWTTSDSIMFKKSFCDYLGIPPRIPEDTILKYHKDLAAATQKIYEDIFLHVICHAKKISGESNLCLSGGCAYNGLANTLAYKHFEKIWIPYAPSDSGSSIGACLSRKKYFLKNANPFLGPEFSDAEVESALEGMRYQKLEEADLIKRVANDIHSGKIVASFRGRMEFGARALGNRSILASPLVKDMKDRLNSVVKKREAFRPFAPSCLEESYNSYFFSEEPIPYMNQIVKVKSKDLPSITHIDGTARLHTVSQAQNTYFHKLLTELGEISGYPICLNTSFNFKDQTITLSPAQAVERFLDSEIDILIINNFYLTK